MSRKLAVAVPAILLLAGTVAVVWSGLNGPPPLWIVEYGLPGAQGPTGRVARIEGYEFLELRQGYFQSWEFRPPAEALRPRLMRYLGVPEEGWPPEGWYRVGAPGTESWEPVGYKPHPVPGAWHELPQSVWIGTGYYNDGAPSILSLADTTRLPIRWTSSLEADIAARAVVGRTYIRRFPWSFGLTRSPPGHSPAFSLTPNQEHLVEPYLVEGERGP